MNQAAFSFVFQTVGQTVFNALKGRNVNNPYAGYDAGVQAARDYGQAIVVYKNIVNSLGVIKNAKLQTLADNGLSAMTAVQGAIDQLRDAWPALESLWDQRNTARQNYTSLNTLLCGAVNSYLQCAITSCGVGKSLPPDTGTDDADLNGPTVTSLDPNDKVGSTGSGPLQYVSGGAAVPYSVYFENQPTATAPAQKVTVTDTLNPNLDLTTLMLGPIAVPNQVITPPSIPLSVAPFTTTMDLRPTTNLLVKINAYLNATTGVLTSGPFQSLDPATNQPPTDPLAGFLPPSAEGSVFFTVMPKSTVTTGSVIQNTATVVFDVNQPINTPTWSNTIDNTKP